MFSYDDERTAAYSKAAASKINPRGVESKKKIRRCF
jgi:hypothetical protein